ncbi:MAG: TIR domain-containing protein, partial [Ignavibacteria bacterium]|nr:TIR domain-containing protein [Ignavibacteria bacterium]
MYNKVFISYAKEDYIFAEKLYDFLREQDYMPWFDKKCLLPGQLWNNEIRKALREANYVILLLSGISVKKRGYVQREFKLAIEYFEEKLDDDIYIIPLKIDDCEIPNTLNKFQWIEFDDYECFTQILNSINTQRNKYEDYERKKIASKEIFAYEEVLKEFEYSKDVTFNIKSTIIRFKDDTNENLLEINSIIQGRNYKRIASARNGFFELNGSIIAVEFSRLNWLFDISYSPNLITNKIISITESTYAFAGGAHGNNDIEGFNFFVNPIFIIHLEDIFEYEDHANILNFFSDFCYEELKRRHNEWIKPTDEEISNQTKESLFWEGSLAPKWEKFDNFLISKSGLDIIFGNYSVSAYAFGLHIINIPYPEIIKRLSKPEKILML